MAKAWIARLGLVKKLPRNRSIKSLDRLPKGHVWVLVWPSPEPVCCHLPKAFQFHALARLCPFPTVPHLAEVSKPVSLCIWNGSKWHKLMIHQTPVLCMGQFWMQNRNAPKTSFGFIKISIEISTFIWELAECCWNLLLNQYRSQVSSQKTGKVTKPTAPLAQKITSGIISLGQHNTL